MGMGQMGKNTKRLICLLALLLCASGALADGHGEWVHSKIHGYVPLAEYVGAYDG